MKFIQRTIPFALVLLSLLLLALLLPSCGEAAIDPADLPENMVTVAATDPSVTEAPTDPEGVPTEAPTEPVVTPVSSETEPVPETEPETEEESTGVPIDTSWLLPADAIDPAYVFSNEKTDADNVEAFSGLPSGAERGLWTHQTSPQLEGVVPEIRVSPFTSESAPYKHSVCSELKNGSGEYGSFYSIYDYYSNDKETLNYLHGTDLLCGYTVTAYGSDKTVTPEEAIQTANEFLLRFLSEEQLAKYEAPYAEDGKFYMSQYVVRYMRKVAGYNTDDELSVAIAWNGSVQGYSGHSLCKYDGLADTISADDVRAAEIALLSKAVSLGVPVSELPAPFITTNTTGELFLEADIVYRDSRLRTHMEILFVNIVKKE